MIAHIRVKIAFHLNRIFTINKSASLESRSLDRSDIQPDEIHSIKRRGELREHIHEISTTSLHYLRTIFSNLKSAKIPTGIRAFCSQIFSEFLVQSDEKGEFRRQQPCHVYCTRRCARGDRFSGCRLSENVMHIPCLLHTALRGSSREVAALGCN